MKSWRAEFPAFHHQLARGFSGFLSDENWDGVNLTIASNQKTMNWSRPSIVKQYAHS